MVVLRDVLISGHVRQLSWDSGPDRDLDPDPIAGGVKVYCNEELELGPRLTKDTADDVDWSTVFDR